MSRRGRKKRQLRREEINLRGEADYIARRAAERDARTVTLGPLVFFSTETGDAWMLDPQDGLALCLARDGDPQPARFVETPESFGVEWEATYAIEGDAFIVADRSGRTRTIIGYPTQAIQDAIRQASRRAA